ncbi:helix-turn-helix domain-containing protein [Kribbella sp. VKM Ac-2566]|uniref:AraC family transcriptional regulator n=1 Tax=Kribbella sp. VKM Ac-2566 TaxID=2512218 RepID=UPI0010630466|nr:helix-turn-helix domain-containing protein [Kribbella sp. VKM Ac-2566]
MNVYDVVEALPAPPLREYVRCYHYARVDLGDAVIRKPLTARPEQMMQFNLAQPFAVVDRRSGAEASAPDVVIVGRQTRRNLDLRATGRLITLTVHFQPTGFYRLFHVPLRHVTDLTPDATDVVGVDVREVHERVVETPDDLWSMVAILERFLLTKVSDSRPLHPVQSAARSMLHGSAPVGLGTMAAQSQISVRQFERVFLEQVGVAPQMFGRIARFARALQSKSDEPDRTWSEVVADAGYYDQMHFVRDCRAFGGDTPTALMRTWIDCRP